jgi:hypothetical protein
LYKKRLTIKPKTDPIIIKNKKNAINTSPREITGETPDDVLVLLVATISLKGSGVTVLSRKT